MDVKQGLPLSAGKCHGASADKLIFAGCCGCCMHSDYLLCILEHAYYPYYCIEVHVAHVFGGSLAQILAGVPPSKIQPNCSVSSIESTFMLVTVRVLCMSY